MKGRGRNTPCPCGSGRKYKHCCLALGRRDFDEVAARNAFRIERVARALRALRSLIAGRRWEEAEAICEELRADFPGEPVPDIALAGVRSAQGRWEEEADLAERAALACLDRGGAGNGDLAMDLLEGAFVARERARCADEILAAEEPFPEPSGPPDRWHPAPPDPA